MEAIALLVTAIVVPYVVQLIKQQAITGKAAYWLAVGVSIVAGICVGFVGGIPETIGDWVLSIVAAISGVQLAYVAYKSVGITSKALDALANITVPATKVDDPLYISKQQSIKDHAENTQDKE